MSRVAVVTGANKGIGLRIVYRLCRDPGLTVVLTSRNEELGADAVKAVAADPETKTTPIMHQLDISSEESVARLHDFLREKFGGVDVLINNAGFAYKNASTAPFEEQARVTMDINYYGTLRVTQKLLPLMRPGGRIVNVSSFAGQLSIIKSPELRECLASPELTVPELSALMEQFVADAKAGVHQEKGWSGSAYGMSKVGVTGLTRVLAREASRENKDVVITCCCPGWCKTDMAGDKAPRTADEGADTPVWLAVEAAPDQVHGQFVRDRVVSQW